MRVARCRAQSARYKVYGGRYRKDRVSYLQTAVQHLLSAFRIPTSTRLSSSQAEFYWAHEKT